jgi:hypothetical protein
MNRAIPIVLSLLSLGGCMNDPSSSHHNAPPKDPQDYHGVPTDDKPPMMIIAPAAPQ